MEVKVHPFDLDYDQIIAHRDSIYKQAKGVIRSQAFKPADATVQSVLDSIKHTLNLPQNVIQNIQNQITLSGSFSKITFTDFLQILQKEAFFRECLSDVQMYKLSACRLTYSQELPLLNLQQLEILKKQQRQKGSTTEDNKIQKLPNFSQQIDNLLLFEYSGVNHLMVAFENKSVQVFDFQTGESLFEFNFQENKLVQNHSQTETKFLDLEKQLELLNKKTSSKSAASLNINQPVDS